MLTAAQKTFEAYSALALNQTEGLPHSKGHAPVCRHPTFHSSKPCRPSCIQSAACQQRTAPVIFQAGHLTTWWGAAAAAAAALPPSTPPPPSQACCLRGR